MFTKRIRIFVFFCISVMAESEKKSREAKLDFDEDVLAGKKGKLEITFQEMDYLSSVSVRGRCESIKCFKANSLVLK